MASPHLVEFSTGNWQAEVVDSGVPVVVDFWAPWCGPCRQLTPTIERLAAKYAGKVKVGKLNVDDAQDIAVKYAVNTIPRVFIFKGSDKPQTLTLEFGGRSARRSPYAAVKLDGQLWFFEFPLPLYADVLRDLTIPPKAAAANKR